MIPTLTTARLTLRPQRLEDFEPFAALLATERAVHMGGPLSRDRAWTWFCSDEAGWTFHGHGGLTITETATGRVAGQTGILQPPRFPERELGWLIYDGMTGKGYGTEAAAALRDWGFGQGLPTLVSYIDPDNRPSRRLAERLGATVDPDAPRPDGDGCLVYRHARSA